MVRIDSESITPVNRKTARFSRHLWLTSGVFVLFAAIFAVYVYFEKQIDRANELRIQSFLLAQELRQSSDDLSRMARTYVVTGDLRYKRYFHEILDIRDGKRPRPRDYHSIYWDLVLDDDHRPQPAIGAPVALLDLMQRADFAEQEFAKLAQAKARSDALTMLEQTAMGLVEIGGADRAMNRDQAIQMLHGPVYLRAKTEIMRPIGEFHQLMEQRTLAAVRAQETMAMLVRVVCAALGLVLAFLLWRTYRSLIGVLGGSVEEVYQRIALLGRGDFSLPLPMNNGMPAATVLGWLAQTQGKLAQMDAQHREAEAKHQLMARLYNALSECNQAIVRCHSEEELFPRVCRAIVTFGGMKMAWIGMINQHGGIVPVASYGEGTQYLEGLVISTRAADAAGRGPTGTAVREDSPFWCQDFQHSAATAPWHERGAHFGWRGSAALPLHRNGVVIGALTLYAPELNAFDEPVRNLLIEMAMDIDYALESFMRQQCIDEAQTALAGSLSLLQTIIDTVPVRIFWKDHASRYLGGNLAFARDAGVATPQELIGKDDYALAWKEQAELYRADDRSVMDSATQRLGYEEPITWSDGILRWIRVSKVPLRNQHGEVVSLLGVYEDVTENRKAEKALRASEARYHGLYSSMTEGMALHELLFEADRAVDYVILDVNPAYETILGLERAQVIGRRGSELYGAAGVPYLDIYANVAISGHAVRFETVFAPMEKTFLINAFSPALHQFATVFEDITARKQAEAHQRLAANVFAHSLEGILITNAENRIVEVNPSFTRITGYTREEVLGRDPKFLASGQHDEAFYAAMRASLRADGFWQGEIWNQRKNGKVYAELLSVSVVRGDDGVVQNYIAAFTDISQIKEHEAELDHIAHYDHLTGLPNRRLLTDRLGQAVARSHRTGKSLAVCYLDLDGFKPVNDKYGHEIGDQLLIAIAEALRNFLRAEDTLAHLGGDEFVLLFPELAHPDDCFVLLNRVLAAIHTPIMLHGDSHKMSASIGVTLCPPDAEDADQLLRHADQAMYRAKEAGKNCYHLYDPDQDRRLQSRKTKLRQLKEALVHDEFVLYYQPKVNLVTREVIGAEALIRWQHPIEGLLPPSAFLPDIEGSDLETAVGEWVIDSALRQIAIWRQEGLVLAVSVNISASHLLQPDFTQRLSDRLADHPGVRPDDLELEILESAALDDVQQAKRILVACHELGVHIALDDFGTGYSSLAYFRTLPVDVLKIDQSFVRDMLDDPNDREIVESVVKLANAFSRMVIAEGVETPAHGALLTRLGCRFGQGYGIARPMPADRMLRWVADWLEKT